MKKLTFTKIVFLMLTILTMAGIFLFSCENSDRSSDTSGNIVDILINIFVPDFNSMTVNEQAELLGKLSHIVRKTAHFTVFTALGLFASLTVGKRKLLSIKTLLTLIFCFLYACSDEFHQYFVPGRACMFTDVLLDSCGSLTGIALSYAVFAVSEKRAKKSAVPQ